MQITRLVNQAKDLARYFRFRPFDRSTESGRADERQRRIVLTVLLALIAKGVALGVNLISIPLTVQYLGPERFGMWATVTGLIAMMSFSDFGLGNGLLNVISEAYGNGDRNSARTYVSSGFFFLLGVALLFGTAFFSAYRFIPWHALFNVSSTQAIQESAPAVAAFVACFLIALPINSVERIRLGYQEGFVNSIWTIVGNLIALGGLFTVIKFQGGLGVLVLALLGGPLLAKALNGLYLTFYTHPWLFPKPAYVKPAALKKLLRLGGLFFFLQLAAAVGYQSDNIVIAQILGAEAVAEYAIPAKLFSIVSILGGVALAALWPAYAEATSQKDFVWVRKALNKSLLITFMAYTVPVLILTTFGRQILNLWVGESIEPNYLLLYSLGAWTMLISITGPISSFMNGTSIIGFQVTTALSMAIMNIALSIFLVHKIGIAGAALGSFISVLICIVIPSYIYLNYYFARQVPGESTNEKG